MPKIDFYILSDTKRLEFACRLIEKIYKQQHRIYIHTDNSTEAYRLDEMLWTYSDTSFLPHNLYGEGPEPAPPIQIGYQTTPEKHRDILLNLSANVPEFFQRFNRVLELVSEDAAIQEAARVRFRWYRAQHLEVTTHNLRSKTTN